MKTKLSSLLVAGLFLSAAITVFAGPSTTYETLNRPQQFQQLKAGDRIVYVCNECKTVTEVSIGSPAQAMEYCKEGGSVTCPACKKTFKIVTRGSSKSPSTERQIVYTNDKGEECLFIAKAPNPK